MKLDWQGEPSPNRNRKSIFGVEVPCLNHFQFSFQVTLESLLPSKNIKFQVFSETGLL